MYEQNRSDVDMSEEESLQRATSMLDRVKVMRVFEIAGLIDAVSEVAQICESATRKSNESTHPRAKMHKIEVADSEDESGGDDSKNSDNTSTQARIEDDLSSPGELPPSLIGMVIIDTIANMIGPLLSKSQVQGTIFLNLLLLSIASRIF